MASISSGCRLLAALLLAGCLWPMPGRAQIEWNPVKESTEDDQSQQLSGPNHRWDAAPQIQKTKSGLVWEPLSPEQADTTPEDLIWSEPSSPKLFGGETALEQVGQRDCSANKAA